MLPVTHTDLLVILAFTVAITVAGFSFMTFMVYQEEEKTRALLREHGWP